MTPSNPLNHIPLGQMDADAADNGKFTHYSFLLRSRTKALQLSEQSKTQFVEVNH